jgi:hypothetical protein
MVAELRCGIQLTRKTHYQVAVLLVAFQELFRELPLFTLVDASFSCCSL